MDGTSGLATGQLSISILRSSFIWFRPHFGLLAQPAPATPLGFVGSKQGFVAAFDAAKVGSHPEGLEQPWPRPWGQMFWTYYLEGTPPGKLTGTQAFRDLVPLRVRPTERPEAPGLGLRLRAEQFLYPHGVAFAITAEPTSATPLDTLVDRLVQLVRTAVVRDGTQAAPSRLGEYAARQCDALARRVLGANVPVVNLDAPFTVTTPMRGTSAVATAPIADGDAVHHVLEGLAHWSQTWRIDALGRVAPGCLPTAGNSPPGHALWATRRARVVWFPAAFSRTTPSTSLSCYHRNLFYAALQVESLIALLVQAAMQIDALQPLSTTQSDCLKRAVGLLARMFSGDKQNTYRSMSVRQHIEDNRKAEVNKLRRDYFGLPPL